jgi:hypothetical protein
MTNVVQLRSTVDLPTQLRALADDLEQGDEAMPRAMLSVLIYDDGAPLVLSLGRQMSQIEEVGALQTGVSIALGVVHATDDG